MKNILIIVTMIALAGCQSSEILSVDEIDESGDGLISNTLSGSWVGELVQFTTKELEDSDSGKIYQVILLNCEGAPEIWLKSDDSGFSKIYGDYHIQSAAGNHLLSIIVDGGAWVETQSWGLVTINATKAVIQWNRMVSNPYLSDQEPLRSFGQMGFGELTKESGQCDVWEEDDDESAAGDAGTSA